MSPVGLVKEYTKLRKKHFQELNDWNGNKNLIHHTFYSHFFPPPISILFSPHIPVYPVLAQECNSLPVKPPNTNILVSNTTAEWLYLGAGGLPVVTTL